MDNFLDELVGFCTKEPGNTSYVIMRIINDELGPISMKARRIGTPLSDSCLIGIVEMFKSDILKRSFSALEDDATPGTD